MNNILKEEVINKLLKNKKDKIIYISNSIKNLEYYHYKLLEEGYSSTLFDDVYLNNEKDDSIITEFFDKLNNKNKEYIFLHFSLSLNLNLENISYIDFKVDKTYDKEKLFIFLKKNFTYSYILNKKNQYSIKNDIIEIFSNNIENPIRFSFFDDYLETIKEFDIENQKSIRSIDNVRIYENKENKENIFFIDYLKDYNNYEIILENYDLINSTVRDLETFNEEKYTKILSNSKKIYVSINPKYEYKYKRVYKKKLRTINLNEIEENDYVIHLNYGIGIYKGIQIIDNKEYIVLKYADQDKLYIPIDRIDKLEKYYNQETPTIYKLGTKKFKKKLLKLQEKIDEFILDLIDIEAKRKQITGFVYKKDSFDQKKFEDEFEFELTKDQIKAVEDIKSDMESNKLMDRLICADVGFGKTEVSMRAIFKAVDNGKQVALISPTTVLANQHYERFVKRFKNYPINILSLSRLDTTNRSKQIEKIKNHQIDIVIGTHSILSENIQFKNLGLVVIDEEQKFGVMQKENLKLKYPDVDIIYLTATPIPRTLNMTMLGLKDISLIETMPQNRMGIKTEILEYDEERIRKCILKEISRDGQVFYVTNNVKNMKEKTEELRNILPKYINVEYIHGKLTSEEIKNKINRFDKGEFSVLVASSIIENGIDISNANTIIIEKFESLGLSQIYQLRGRVGRGTRLGYCYLIKMGTNTSKAKNKIETMENIENLNGINLSIEDLRIRGAGEILGSKQHGVIENFGYDVYIKMLKESIDDVKHKKKLNKDVNIKLKENGMIPEEYIKGATRLHLYKRFLNAMSNDEIDEIKEELQDRFGKYPKEVEKFIIYLKIRLYAIKNSINQIEEKNEQFHLYITKNNKYVVSLNYKDMMERIKK